MTERNGYKNIKFHVPPELRLAEALCEACDANNLEAARRLVDLGADPNTQSYAIEEDGNIPERAALHHAVRHNNHELITLLLNAGADVNLEYHGGYKPLHEVCWAQLHSEPTWLRQIIQATENINRPEEDGFSVLHYAATFGAPQFVQMLLDHGASVNESSQTHHVLDAAIESKNPTTFGLIWNLSDKQLFKSLAKPEYYICIMLKFGWYKPDKVSCLYEVLDVVDKFTTKYTFLYHIAMAEFGYEKISYTDEVAERELMTTIWPSFEFGDPQFLKINLCDIIRRLHAHGEDLNTSWNKLAIIYLCYKYNICKNIERQYELLDTITELGVDLTDMGLFACANYPKFAIMMLKYSSKIKLIDIFANTFLAKRCDRALLNCTITLLMLYSPEVQDRKLYMRSLTQKLHYIAIHRFNTHTVEYQDEPFFLCINKSEFNDLFVREERRALLQKLDTLLRIDRVPTLLELARNKIRLSLKDKTPKEFLKTIEELNVPEYIADIIQCQAPVYSFQEEDLGGMKVPKFPFFELRFQRDTSSTSPGTILQQLQTFQYQSNLSPIIDCRNENLEQRQLLRDVDKIPTDTNCCKKFYQIIFSFILVILFIRGVIHLLNDI